MGTAQKFLRAFQSGFETVYGTPVAATQKLVANNFNSPVTPGIYYPDQQRGLLAEVHPGVQTSIVVGHDWETELSFEQILTMLDIGVKHVATPTGAGAEKTWLYAPSATGSDAIGSITVEKRETDGTTNWDYQYPGTQAKTIEIAGAANGIFTAKAGLFSKTEAAAAITAAIAQPSGFFGFD